MKILNFKHCDSCYSINNDNRELLSKFLPNIIVDNICSFGCCSYCSEIINDEDEILLEDNGQSSKVELQVRYCKRNYYTELNPKHKIPVKINFLCSVIDKSETPFKGVLKSYIKFRRSLFFEAFHQIIENLDKKAQIKEILERIELTYDAEYSFYGKQYPGIFIFKMVVYEYLTNWLEEMFYQGYIEIDDIQNYLDEIFPNMT